MKIPKAQKLPSGNWRVGLMVDGRRISITEPTKKAAETKAAAIKAGMKTAVRKEITVRDAITQYIDSKDAVLSPSTVAGYRRILAHAFPDWLLALPAQKATQQAVQRATNEMAKERSPKSVRNAHGLLSAALTAFDPDISLHTTFPQKIKYDVAIPSVEDIRKIAAAAKGTRDELPIMLAIWLGLRMSEILGLKWDDLDGNVLHIRRAKVDEGEKTTKTYSSQRDLPVPEYILGLMESAPHTSGHVIPEKRQNIYTRFQTICKRAGVQHYRFHDLRHINASVMLALGVPDKYAQERMGHATDNMLKTVYQHTMTAEQSAVADRVDAFFQSIIAPD